MKLLPFQSIAIPNHSWHQLKSFSRVLSALYCSTHTSSSSAAPIGTLCNRISKPKDTTAPILPVLEQWIDEGNDVKQSELKKVIKQLRRYRRFKHALQISEWMSDQGRYLLSPGDLAVQLDLISKVHDLEQVEKFFNSIPEISRNFRVYGALLNCYAHKRCLEKAEDLMQKMRELGFLKTSLPYNVMLDLYSEMGKYEKLDVLLQEMGRNGIQCDLYTYSIRLNAYIATSNIEEMEKLIVDMENNPHVIVDWHAYAVAAKGYMNAGLIEKTLTMLRRSEQLSLSSGYSKFIAYEVLLTSYAAVGEKDEVFRLWKLYKNSGKFFNSGYLSMISSLLKLDDVDAAEEIYEEWESRRTLFDIRVPNAMISGFSKKGLWKKAEAYVNKIMENGKEPNTSTWDHLATGYYAAGHMENVAETIKKAILTCKTGYKPNVQTFGACLEYLKAQGNMEVAEELLNLAKKHCNLAEDGYDRLLNYIGKEDLDTGAVD